LGDVAALAASIREVGLLHPITVTPERRLLAGLHRLAACRRLGWRMIDAVVVDVDELRTELVELDENLQRLDLTVLERGESLARRKQIHELLHPETKANVAGAHGSNRAQGRDAAEIRSAAFASGAAARLGVTPRSVRMEIQIANALTSDVKEALRGTAIADSKVDLLQLARAEPEEQRSAARMLVSGEADSAKLAIAEVRRRRRMAGMRDPGRLEGLQRRYAVIYADPPWRYDHSPTAARRVENVFPTMDVGAIAALPVAGIAAEDSILFLWSPAPKLVEALRVMEAWQFRYVTCLVWAKTGALGMGYRARVEHELLLLGTKGDPPTPSPRDRPRSVVVAPRGRHSEKPDAFYTIIEKAYPGASRIELFARQARRGWDAWGNEVAPVGRDVRRR